MTLERDILTKMKITEIPDMHKLNVLSWVISVIFGVIGSVCIGYEHVAIISREAAHEKRTKTRCA